MTKQELRTAADACFKANPKTDIFHQTADGQCFAHWHDANEHSKTIGNRAIEEVQRDDAKKGTLTADEKVEQINACKTIDELTAIQIGNKENQKVKDAMDARLKVLAEEETKNKK